MTNDPYPEYLRDTAQKIYGHQQQDNEIKYDLAVEEAYKKMTNHPDSISPKDTIEVVEHFRDEEIQEAEELLEEVRE